MKQKFIPTFSEVIKTFAVDIPKVFFTAHPIYRAMKRAGISKKRAQAGLYNLQSRGIIKNIGKGYVFTKKGDKWFKPNPYMIERPKIWDRKWRIILFDIPSLMERQRKSFRTRLKMAGAYMIQESVFAYPFPCEEEIGYWVSELGLDDYIEVITAENVGSREAYLKQHFKI